MQEFWTKIESIFVGLPVGVLNVLGLVIAALLFVVIIVRMYRDSRRIKRLMYRDYGMMDVWNMNYLIYKANESLPTGGKDHHAIVYVNISQFRTFNSLYGWARGQELLDHVVSVIKSETSASNDIFARDQGDRFILFVKFDYRHKLKKRVEELKRKIEESVHEEFALHMTLVIGICVVPADAKEIESSIANSNVAMDAARAEKEQGIVFFDEALERTLKEEHQREQKLKSVSIEDDFFAYYQPKFDIRTNKIVGAEALVRFKDPTDGGKIKQPCYFVPYYERTGKIMDVDFRVLECVCKMLRQRIVENKPVVTISCNFSRYHFMNNGFAERFERTLGKYGISKDLIEVEVTETVVMDELQRTQVKKTFDDLHARGIRLSIDDFGSGYSSLGVFEQIPASVIKLDRSFLLNRADRERQTALMKGLVALADALDAQVVCEGVEFDADVELMREIGANVAQGFKFSKPIPEHEFGASLDAVYA